MAGKWGPVEEGEKLLAVYGFWFLLMLLLLQEDSTVQVEALTFTLVVKSPGSPTPALLAS
jgi:hypothetical protein